MKPLSPEALPQRQVLGADQIRAALRAASANGGAPMQALEEATGLAQADLVAALGAALHYPVLDMDALHALTAAFDVVPYVEASRRDCIAFRDGAGALVLAISDPFDEALLDWAESVMPGHFTTYLASRGDIAAWLARVEEGMRALDSLLPETAADTHSASIDDLSLISISEGGSPVVRLVHSTLYDGLKSGASDIHLEADAAGLVIKYRIDGVLTPVGNVAGVAVAEQVLSRIKVMAELDIAERRVPQDGRFKVAVRGREVDFRVSIMPSLFGEDAVLRILDRRSIGDPSQGLRLDHFGFDPDTLAGFRRLAAEPYGMALVTGPTGSGKTTTLYGALCEINHGTDKIITIEDPVEYQLQGILQIPVNEKKGLSFARGLRSILRHDPDKIMVGEIRDPETAQIAVQSALTGHLVLTTVHANNVFDVLGRFIHMGVDPYSFVSALNGILAQRLVRVNCPQCTVDAAPTAALIAASALDAHDLDAFRFRQGRGCGHCRGTGYKGRKAVGELLALNDEIRELIVTKEPLRRIKEAARRAGTRTLRERAVELVRAGETTLQEINRVTISA